MSLKALTLALLAVATVVACGPSGAKSGQAAGAAPAAAAGTDAAATAGAPRQDLLAFASGAMIVVEPADSDDAQLAWSPYNMIDEWPITEWVGKMAGPPVFVFELAGRSELTSMGFDTGAINEQSGARSIKVEVSDQSESAGFEPLLTATLVHGQDGQDFKAATPRTGRWVRITVLANGGGENASLAGAHAYGKLIALAESPTGLSGTYEGYSGIGPMFIKQEGTRIVGCYQYLQGQISGGTEGRMIKVELRETQPDGEVLKPLGLFNFVKGKYLRGFTRNEGTTEGFSTYMAGEKVSDDIGDCPKIPGYRTGSAAGSQIETQLAAEGRVRLDGVNFDFNSDIIQPASRPLLDQIATVLKGKPALKVTLEGHTDNIGGAAFNKGLSDRRARAVKTYLVEAGVPEAQLTAVGFGLDKPVAGNDSEAGRSQNRRVELVRNQG